MKPNIIIRKENFPNDGEAYVVGEQMGRCFFAWGPEYPFADELPEEDITNGESGIEWFESIQEAYQKYQEALQEYLDDVDDARESELGEIKMKPKRVQFVVNAKEYFRVDADRLEEAEDDDVCLVTIDFDNQRADFIWYNPNAIDSINRNPASFPAEEDDFDAVVALWEELGRPGSEPEIIIKKENFPIDGEAYVVGEQMGRYFFAWGPEYPFADELPEEDITNGESGIQWFETAKEALQEYLDAVDAAYELSCGRNLESRGE